MLSLRTLRRLFANQPAVVQKGTSWSLERQFSRSDVETYAELSGDKNPVHLDEKAAAASMFKKPIAHGMLGASLFSNVLGNNIPGAIYTKQTLKFTKPIYFDEKVTAVLTVIETNPQKKRIVIETKVVKPDGTNAIEGEALVWVNNEAIEVK